MGGRKRGTVSLILSINEDGRHGIGIPVIEPRTWVEPAMRLNDAAHILFDVDVDVMEGVSCGLFRRLWLPELNWGSRLNKEELPAGSSNVKKKKGDGIK